MEELFKIIVGVISMSVLAIIGWAFNISSRVSVQEQRHDDLKELIEVKSDFIIERLSRIERGMNGALRGH